MIAPFFSFDSEFLIFRVYIYLAKNGPQGLDIVTETTKPDGMRKGQFVSALSSCEMFQFNSEAVAIVETANTVRHLLSCACNVEVKTSSRTADYTLRGTFQVSY